MVDGDETPDVLVRATPEDSVLLVAFGGLYMRVGIADFEFFEITADLPAGLVFLRDPSKRIYQRGLSGLGDDITSMAEGLRRIIDGRPWIAVGNSGGGFAALQLGAMCGAEEVHAFASVTFLDRRRRRRHGDDRFAADIDAINADPRVHRRFLDVKPWMRKAIRPTAFHLYYAQDYDIDRLHAERLRRVAGVRLHPRPGKTHGVIRDLALSGELKALLAAGVDRAHGQGATR